MIRFLASALLFISLLLPVSIIAEPGGIPETLVYDLSWTGVPVGTARQSITYAKDGNIVVTASFRSNSWLSSIHSVDNLIEAVLKPKAGFLPGESLKFHMRFNEGGRLKERTITFDHQKKSALFVDNVTDEKVSASILPGTTDVTSGFYHARRLPLIPGDSLSIPVIDGKEPYLLEIKVIKKERIKTIFGKIDTIVVQPMVRAEGTFEGKRGVTLWVTDDARRIPVRIKTGVTVGSVTANLSAVE